MNHMHTNPTLIQINTDNQIDYSELYRKQETKQLKKRLRKTRNTLLICGLAFIAGASVFFDNARDVFYHKRSIPLFWAFVCNGALIVV